jgi:hypothetical protein
VLPRGAFSHCLSRVAEFWTFTFPSSLARAKDQPQPWRRLEYQAPSSRGSAAPPPRRRVEVGQPLSRWAPSAQPPSRVRRAAH